MKELAELFIVFARIGAVTFGGGYAMLPILQREIVDSRGWATSEELMDYYAIGQCTPGIIAVNTATFIGNKRRGLPGGIAATLGFVFPSIVIISIIAAFLTNFADLPVVRDAFAGIRVCVFVLILNATVRLSRSSVKDTFALIVFLVVMAGSTILDLSPAVYVLIAGAAGILIKTASAGKEKDAGDPASAEGTDKAASAGKGKDAGDRGAAEGTDIAASAGKEKNAVDRGGKEGGR